jgi:hypothetical protein
MLLTLSRQDIADFSHKNQYALMMFMDAGFDYIAARCCILNMLHSGFRLASDAVEKLLKAHIFLATAARTKLHRKDLHNPYALKQELNSLRFDKRLDSYDDLLRKLYDHFEGRYFDNPVSGKGASSEELAQIDGLFMYLVETLPMPDEVKYRSSFLASLCDENSRTYWKNYYWAVERNPTLQAKMPQIEQTYQEVLKHLYGV